MARKRIKVAHIITQLELGGAQQNTLYTVEHLARERFEPILLCGRGAYLDKETERVDFQTFFINSLVRPVSPFLDLVALAEIFLVLRREKPLIVHTHSSKAGILGRWAARLAGVPLIIHTFHGFGFTPEQNFWTRRFFIWLEKAAARISTALVAVSHANREEALSLGIGRSEQYRLIRSGVPLGLYRSLTRRPNVPDGLSLGTGHKLVTTVGPFKPQKNLADFIRAAARVHAQFPDARFLMVGDGDERPELERIIRGHRLEDVFLLPGWRRDIPHLFMRTTVFALTSLWEGLPRALVEAMASGLPCVANAVDGVRDVVADGVNGFLTPPKRPDLTAERILQLLQNPRLALQMGERARESVRSEFDIDHMVLKQEELYEELADRNV